MTMKERAWEAAMLAVHCFRGRGRSDLCWEEVGRGGGKEGG